MKRLALALLAAAWLLAAGPALAAENSRHTMTGGSFGVAWIGAQGAVYRSDGRSAPAVLLPDFRAYKLVAADSDGDGKGELALLDDANKSLFVFDFDGDELAGGYGSNVAELSAGKCSPDEKFDSILACTFTGVSYRWTVEVGNQHWHELPGDFVAAAAAELDARNRVAEFATVARGDVYDFNPQWKAYSQLLMGRNARAVIAGDLSASPGDEVVAACGDEAALVLCMKGRAEELNERAACLAVGKPAEGRAKLFVVTPQGQIKRYDRDAKTWTPLSDTAGWANVVLCDTDGDGLDELFALKKDSPEALYRFDPDKKTFQPVE